MKFFDKTPSGRIINRISNDQENIDDHIPWSGHIFVDQFIMSIGMPIVICIILPWISVAVIIIFIAILKINQFYRKSNRDLKRLSSVNEGKLLTHLNECVAGSIVIQAHDKIQDAIEEFKERQLMCLAGKIGNQQCF